MKSYRDVRRLNYTVHVAPILQLRRGEPNKLSTRDWLSAFDDL